MPSSSNVGLPTSGSEPVFEELPWSLKKGVKGNNCYSYAMDNYANANRRPIKAVPGDVAKLPDLPYDKPMDCKVLTKRVLADNPHTVYAEKSEVPCKKGYYKVMMFVDSKDVNMSDFHFYKQHRDVDYTLHEKDTIPKIARMFRVTPAFIRRHNPDATPGTPGTKLFLPGVNVWSHKLGHATGALLVDSCGRIIKDPRKACRSYSHKYKDFCGGFCAKKGGQARTSIHRK